MFTFKKNVFFRKSIKGISKFKQDTVFHNRRSYIKKKEILYKKNVLEQDMHSYYFFNYNNTFNFKNNFKTFMDVKNIHNKLNNKSFGKFIPDIFLDLHGVNQYQAKKEIGMLISLCYKERISCAGVLHGHGKNILKKYVPFWLNQHPRIFLRKVNAKNFLNNISVIFTININN